MRTYYILLALASIACTKPAPSELTDASITGRANHITYEGTPDPDAGDIAFPICRTLIDRGGLTRDCDKQCLQRHVDMQVGMRARDAGAAALDTIPVLAEQCLLSCQGS